MRKRLLTLACAALLGAPPAGALTVTFTSGFGSSFLEIGSATESDVHHLSTLFPTVVPFVDSDSVTEGASSNASTYDLSDNALTITFAHTRAPSAGAHAVSEGDIYFSVDEDVGYELSGTYSAIDPDGTLIDFRVGLLHLTTPSWLARSVQISRSTVNEAFVVGESGGDFSNRNEGSLAGTLNAGHEYWLSYAAAIVALDAVNQTGDADGSVTLAFIPEPTTALLLACGLVGLGVRRRRTSARVAAPESSAPGAPGRARSPKRPRWLRQHLVSASRHRLPATILQRTPPTRLMRTARIFAMALAAALLWPACAATAVPFVPDFSAGPVVFDFEDGLQGWQLSGNAERLQTQVLGGDWAIFGDGEMLVGNQLPVLRMREIDLSEVARISFEQLLLGSDEGAIFLSHGFCYSSSSGGVFIVCSIDKYSPPFPDPPTNPGTFQFTVHEAFRRTVSLSIGFSTPGGLPKPPNGSVGFIDNITLYPIPEPTTALLLACGLVGLGVRRRLH